MMEKLCEIVCDLLPMYIDGCCSEGTRQTVEEHLEQCPDCKQVYQEMSGQLPVPVEPPEEEENRAAPVLKKGLRRIRRRWLLSLVAVAAAIPLCILGWDQVRGSGLCFTNLRETWIAHAFISDLKRGDYEAAYRHMDVESLRQRWLRDWVFDEDTLSNLEEDGRTIFLRCTQELENAGNITEYQYLYSTRMLDCYSFGFSIRVGGEDYRLRIEVGDGGVQSLAGPDLLSAPGQMAMWSEYLWQYYKGCYFDWEKGEYIYETEQAPAGG